MAEVSFTIFPSNALLPPPSRAPSQFINLVHNASSAAIPPKSPTLYSCFQAKHPKPIRTAAAAGSQVPYPNRSTPARDRVIDFGKYRGRMLGSLPSSYLKWMSKNLRAGDTIEWANLADEVLDDAVYRDRIEWEFAEKILSGDVASVASSGGGTVAELLEISERFGWDNEDKRAWGKINFSLLGTSKGGRIPRVAEKKESGGGGGGGGGGSLKEKEEKVEAEEGEDEERRRERRERARRRRRPGGVEVSDKVAEGEREGGGAEAVVVRSPFPGRESLLRKAMNRQF